VRKVHELDLGQSSYDRGIEGRIGRLRPDHLVVGQVFRSKVNGTGVASSLKARSSGLPARNMETALSRTKTDPLILSPKD
jgi:hypothetical protein